MRQDFWNSSDEAGEDDLDRLFSHLAEHDPPPGRAFDETLASLRNWQPDPPRPRRQSSAWLATLGILVLLMGGLAWLVLAPRAANMPVVADNSLFDSPTQTSVATEAPTLGTTLVTVVSASPTVKLPHPTPTSAIDPVLARLIRLNQREKANLEISSVDDSFSNTFKSQMTPSPV